MGEEDARISSYEDGCSKGLLSTSFPQWCSQLVILTLARNTATLYGTTFNAIDKVEGQLAVCTDVVITRVKEHRDATAFAATMVDDPLGERLDCAARNAASILKEGADAAEGNHAGFIVDADDVLAVLVHAVVVDVSSDLLAEAVCYALVWVLGVAEKEAVD